MFFLCFFLLELYYIKIFFISGIHPLIFSNIMTLKIIAQRGIPDLPMPDILIPDPVVSLKPDSKLQEHCVVEGVFTNSVYFLDKQVNGRRTIPLI
jgi:hypothetical protein